MRATTAAPTRPATITDLADHTPPTRDRYVDFLRALSIAVVVAGHWTIALIAHDGGVIRSTSAIGRTHGLWAATWVCQVMPVFFFVGGYANYVAYQSARRRGATAAEFVRSRVRRLLVPAAAFAAAWAAVQVALHVADIGAPTAPHVGGVALLRGVRPPGQTIPFGPLWFLAVYLTVVCIAPITVALHRRFRWRVPALLAAGAVVADAVGFAGGHPGVRYLNVVFVFLLPHQLGHFYGDGTAVRWSRRALVAVMAASLAALVALTNPWLVRFAGARRFDWFGGIGHYPRSLLGTDIEAVSNAYPPTLCFLLAGCWLIALALLLRPAITRWLQRPAAWRLTIAANARIMSLFLWHMTAYLAAVVALSPLGLGHETQPSARWWLERPVWIAVPAAVLAALVAAFGRFEASGHHRSHRN
jgi:fucose 4-O-acetylase-like acetyltransferase